MRLSETMKREEQRRGNASFPALPAGSTLLQTSCSKSCSTPRGRDQRSNHSEQSNKQKPSDFQDNILLVQMS